MSKIKNFKVIVLCLIIGIAFVFMAGCEMIDVQGLFNLKLTEWQIDTTNGKTQFDVGEEFSKEGIVVKAVCVKQIKDVTAKAEFNTTSYNKDAEGSYIIIVSYKGKTANYNVSVVAEETDFHFDEELKTSIKNALFNKLKNDGYSIYVMQKDRQEGNGKQIELTKMLASINFATKQTSFYYNSTQISELLTQQECIDMVQNLQTNISSLATTITEENLSTFEYIFGPVFSWSDVQVFSKIIEKISLASNYDVFISRVEADFELAAETFEYFKVLFMPLVSSQGFEKVLFEAESEDVTITTNANYLIIEIAGFFENDDIDAF